jgi:hypothetical protein
VRAKRFQTAQLAKVPLKGVQSFETDFGITTASPADNRIAVPSGGADYMWQLSLVIDIFRNVSKPVLVKRWESHSSSGEKRVAQFWKHSRQN